MKKYDHKKDQLKLFSSNETKNPSSQAQTKPTTGKQVFLNPRQEIYNKILNRKME